MLPAESTSLRNYVCLRTTRLTVCVITTFLSFLLHSAVHADSDLVVRWHGDYYQHRWIAGIPGGAPSEILENRNLRGGKKLGAVQYFSSIDEDGDGDNDDSLVVVPFSLTDPLNPPAAHFSNPNGNFYHEDLPSARFYGGLSATYYNHETNRIDQAFIENDGAGGAPNDIGYLPSPYIAGGADYDPAWVDAREAGRHPVDGRYRKTHRGAQEDFAISIYRPTFPHPINPAEDPPEDNLAAFHGAFLWKKEDFLADGDQQQVTLDATSTFSFESTRWWGGVGEVRWIIQDADSQLYISQFSVPGQFDPYGFKNELVDPQNGLWAEYNPTDLDLDFDQNEAALVWHDPMTEGLFSDILAFGLYLENDTPTNVEMRFSLDEVRFGALVGDTFDSADFDTDGFVDADDLTTWQTAFGNSDFGDANGDGDTDGNDFLLWQKQFNGTAGSLTSPLSAIVPEPSTVLLLAVLTSTLVCCPRGYPGDFGARRRVSIAATSCEQTQALNTRH